MKTKKKLSTPDVAELCKCDRRTARNWAVKNGVELVVLGNRGTYLWDDGDIARFKKRAARGRPKNQV
jgi:hypothetical protein